MNTIIYMKLKYFIKAERTSLFFGLVFALFFNTMIGQETFPKNDVADKRPEAFALTNAMIVTAPGAKLENATLLIRNGVVETVASNGTVPDGYTKIDMTGHHIYPSFIDVFSSYGQPEVKKPPRGNPYVKKEQIQSDIKGAYNANEAIKASYNAADGFEVDTQNAKKLREQGFGAVASLRPDGIARGTAALVLLGDKRENQMVVESQVASHFSFDKGSSTQDFPISPMGSIALLRQTFYDAAWYKDLAPIPFTDLSLEALVNSNPLPKIFETNGWLTGLRAAKIAQEFNMRFIIKGGGDEYQRLEEIKATNSQLIIPLNFPKTFDVSNPYITQKISLADLKHWEMAASNPALLEKNGITFALTAHPLGNNNDFLANLRKAISFGLNEETALAALTTVPAKMLRTESSLGSLEKGKIANFLVTDGNLFNPKTNVLENWIRGTRHTLQQLPITKILGTYQLKLPKEQFDLKLESTKGKYKAHIITASGENLRADFSIHGSMASLQFSVPNKDTYTLGGFYTIQDQTVLFSGTGSLNYENEWSWSARKISPLKETANDNVSVGRRISGNIVYPFMAYGNTEKIRPERLLIKNTTVWTNEDAGVLENMDVLVINGKIERIGTNLEDTTAKRIDGTGKHLTPGIIDEHSHIAISAVNDIAANSGMVRMGDVIDSEDISIYRALAGGVVAAHILHGSSDPIGGQSALIKLKWGENPENLKISEASPFIKFALGENPKRSKSAPSLRFPRSLMGLEQFYTNAFVEALDYKKEWNAYNGSGKKQRTSVSAPRTDILKQTMLEIVEGNRFISCHSYQEKEMLMLMDVADRFGFTVNTFTHALEGHRIADKMAAHGVGGSTFSDKWNFKWETRNAIPYNAVIMHREGVTTAINSDSRETIRHLNHEAAKSMKYGGMSAEDALKLITLNPAKLLHLDKTMGSIKEGKSADLVLWSGPPLSIYAKPEKTIVEGAIYFDMDRDLKLRAEIKKERARIIQLMRSEKGTAKAEQKISTTKPEFHCEYLGEE
ncbi:MAG: amidohydrolase family protein [Maribacter sp.]